MKEKLVYAAVYAPRWAWAVLAVIVLVAVVAAGGGMPVLAARGYDPAAAAEAWMSAPEQVQRCDEIRTDPETQAMAPMALSIVRQALATAGPEELDEMVADFEAAGASGVTRDNAREAMDTAIQVFVDRCLAPYDTVDMD